VPPRRRPPRFVAAGLAALALIGAGTGCAAVEPARVAAAAVHQAAAGYGPAQVIDDARRRSVLIVPQHPIGALAVYVHGSGQGRETILRSPRDVAVARELTDHGYLVLAADAGGKAWGNAASVAGYRALIGAAVRRYHVRDVFLMAESMGGLATMQLARQVPDVRAVTAWYPVCDLRTMAKLPRFAAAIAHAWAGSDARIVSPVSVPRVPMAIWASAADTVVSAPRNAGYCAAAEQAAGGSVDYVHTVGEHGDASNFRPQAVLRFFEQHRTAPLTASVKNSSEVGRA
jgi:ribosomal protein S11